MTDRPEVTLLLEGKPCVFLCDTGACRTVVKDMCHSLKPSSSLIRMRSAEGRTEKKYLSQPVSIEIPDTGDNISIPVIIAPSCPYNLLGRDAMQKLKIGIFPTRVGGMKAERCDVCVVDGEGEPYYHWTLDLPSKDAGGTAAQLMNEVQTRVTQKADLMLSTDLQIKLRSKLTPGPDPAYDKVVNRLGPQRCVLTNLYWNNDVSFCTARVPKELDTLMTWETFPHIPCSKPPAMSWDAVAGMARIVSNVSKWTVDPQTGVFTSCETPFKMIKLNWVVTTQPSVHLTDEDDK